MGKRALCERVCYIHIDEWWVGARKDIIVIKSQNQKRKKELASESERTTVFAKDFLKHSFSFLFGGGGGSRASTVFYYNLLYWKGIHAKCQFTKFILHHCRCRTRWCNVSLIPFWVGSHHHNYCFFVLRERVLLFWLHAFMRNRR